MVPINTLQRAVNADLYWADYREKMKKPVGSSEFAFISDPEKWVEEYIATEQLEKQSAEKSPEKPIEKKRRVNSKAKKAKSRQ